VISLPLDEIANPKTAIEIKGEGMPAYSEQPISTKAAKGDLTVRMDIKFPEELTEKQKKELTEILSDP
jgi:DnaJ-class molecular chaperone